VNTSATVGRILAVQRVPSQVGGSHRVRLAACLSDYGIFNPVGRGGLSRGQALLGEEDADQPGHFIESRLQQEVPPVEEVDFGIG
jgi:hypothetical protein